MGARCLGASLVVMLLGCGRLGFDPPARPDDDARVEDAGGEVPTDGPAGCVRKLVAGHRNFCALRFDGSVACWGMNERGQLGTGTNGAYAAPVELPLTGVREVALGGRHVCFVFDDGAIRCAGKGTAGQLGHGSTTDSMELVDVTVIGPVAELQTGPQHTCARIGEEITCWGCSRYARAANCELTTMSPQVRTFESPPVRLDTNFRHSCALLEDGRVGCFGQNYFRELGGGSDPEPGIVYPAITNVTDVAVGRAHTCVVSEGHAYCFGSDLDGELGNGAAGSGPTPRMVVGLSDVASVDAGQTHACAVTTTGEVWCWGNDTDGQVGGAAPTDKHEPIRVPAAPARQIATSRSTTCALTTAGIQCWGSDADGQLGDGPPFSTDRNPTPVDVAITCP